MSTLPPEISREVKVVLLGDSAVGKTSLVFRFVTQTFQPNRDCTIGASFMTKTLSYGDNNIKFQIWDTAGQERYQGIAPMTMYFRGAAAIIIAYDITSKVTFASVEKWVKASPPNVVIAIVGNKCDLHEQREVETEFARRYAATIRNAFAIETSSLDNLNVEELFLQIGKRLPDEMDGKGEGKGSIVSLAAGTKKKGKSSWGC